MGKPLLLPATVASSLAFLLPRAAPSNVVVLTKSQDLSRSLQFRDHRRGSGADRRHGLVGLRLALAVPAVGLLRIGRVLRRLAVSRELKRMNSRPLCKESCTQGAPMHGVPSMNSCIFSLLHAYAQVARAGSEPSYRLQWIVIAALQLGVACLRL